MSTKVNRQVVLAARPEGRPKATDFEIIRGKMPRPGAGQVLLRSLYLSLDPYMRGRMSVAKSYSKPVEIGEVMVGGVVSQIMQSDDQAFAPGEIVFAYSGWQEFAVAEGKALKRVEPSIAPISTALGILGMPGMTAYTGLLNIGKPKPGETLVVAAASGAVGSLVGQIGNIHGCRTIGIAGSKEKCDFVRDELGFDDCVSHRDPELAGALAAACPKGIDIYFENVGGAVFEAVLPLLNQSARVPVCGLISHYNATELPSGPNKVPLLMRAVLTKRLHIEGFIVWDFAAQEAEFEETMSGWLRDGSVKYREDIVDGLENAPEAFIGLLEGRNFGKLVVKIAEQK